jgi:uncharacterized membrane protein YkvA (DUF1232 family)
LIATLKNRARTLKREAYALYIAARDPRVPWYAKVFIGVVLAYAFSPIDLIPDFIPVLGYLDDLIVIPLGRIYGLGEGVEGRKKESKRPLTQANRK